MKICKRVSEELLRCVFACCYISQDERSKTWNNPAGYQQVATKSFHVLNLLSTQTPCFSHKRLYYHCLTVMR